MTLDKLNQMAATIRGRLVALSHTSKAPHLGSSLSCVDMLVALYWGNVLNIDPQNHLDPLRDRFILSKGHAAKALYITLCYKGFFEEAILETYNQDGGKLAEHPGPQCVPGVEAATGSLGHGLPIAVGMALAAKIQHHSYRVIALLSDGECNEGSTWEAAMYAPAHKLENLVILIDYNKWQATDRTQEVTAFEPFKSKWEAFGWNTYEVDGHDIGALLEILHKIPDGSGKPMAIIAHTVKGKGVSFMEDDNNWHYRIPSSEEVEMAKKELGLI